MSNLYQRSIEIILENQAPNGAYIASPHFPTYHFCWFRDASFVAYAMDLVEQFESAQRFHQWAVERVNERENLVRGSIAKFRAGGKLDESDTLNTRYRLDGRPDEPGEWPNFQLDGFGTWLWALNEHMQRSKLKLQEDWRGAANLVADYLSELWSQPCYDCWEEFPEIVHPHTLAAIYGGLNAHTNLTGADHSRVLEAIRGRLLNNAEKFGHFTKFPEISAVDASLLAIAVPYGVFPPDSPIMMKTVEQISKTILRDGGVHRYPEDTYYGGGAWTLLSAWLGWYYHELANCREDLAAQALRESSSCKAWIEKQAGETTGWLPEQVPDHLNKPEFYPEWVARWGQIADPLLWSHANYIILCSS